MSCGLSSAGETGNAEGKCGITAKVVDKVKNCGSDQVHITGVSFKSFIFKVNVSISNPYSCTIPMFRTSYTVKSGGRTIASGKVRNPRWLKAKKKTVWEVPVIVPYDAVATLLKDVKDGDIDYKLEFKISLIGCFPLHFSKEGKIKLETLLDLGKKYIKELLPNIFPFNLL